MPTSFTRLNLSNVEGVTDNGTSYVVHLPALSDLDMSFFFRPTDITPMNLPSIKSFKRLSLMSCTNIEDEGMRHLGRVMTLRDLSYTRDRIINVALWNLTSLASLTSLNL